MTLARRAGSLVSLGLGSTFADERERLGAAVLAPVSTATLAAPALLAAGVAILAWDYAVVPAAPFDFAVYWLGLALAFAGVAVLGLAARAGTGRQLTALGLFGAVTWLPYFLRSPGRLLFVDERFHLDILTQMAARGHAIGLPVTLFPLPGTYPGLEDATLALMAVTGFGPLLAARVVTLALHVAIPMLAYLAARGIGLHRLGAFLAALVFAANTSFVFFHATFSYETLGIVLFLATWVLVTSWRAPGTVRSRARRDLPLVLLALPLVAGIAVTHHVSSYLLAGSLVLAWVALRAQHAPEARGVGYVAVLATVFAGAWFLVSAPEVQPYLVSSIAARAGAIVNALLIAHSAPRALFANIDLPLGERIVAFAYPPLVLLLSIGGLVLARRVGRLRALWIPLALLGPVLWLASAPAVVTSAAELAYRLWPFLFLGVAANVAVALVWLVRRLDVRSPAAALPVTLSIVALLLVGGFSIGDDQAGRFPTSTPTTAAGPANVTAEVIAAARFLRASAGPGHIVDTDSGTGSVFATEGGQRILGWASWFPFVSHDPARILSFLADDHVDYLVLDRQITRLPPRYGTYFGPPAIPTAIDPGQPFPASVVARLDAIPGLERVYESDRIVIWATPTSLGLAFRPPDAAPVGGTELGTLGAMPADVRRAGA